MLKASTLKRPELQKRNRTFSEFFIAPPNRRHTEIEIRPQPPSLPRRRTELPRKDRFEVTLDELMECAATVELDYGIKERGNREQVHDDKQNFQNHGSREEGSPAPRTIGSPTLAAPSLRSMTPVAHPIFTHLPTLEGMQRLMIHDTTGRMHPLSLGVGFVVAVVLMALQEAIKRYCAAWIGFLIQGLRFGLVIGGIAMIARLLGGVTEGKTTETVDKGGGLPPLVVSLRKLLTKPSIRTPTERGFYSPSSPTPKTMAKPSATLKSAPASTLEATAPLSANTTPPSSSPSLFPPRALPKGNQRVNMNNPMLQRILRGESDSTRPQRVEVTLSQADTQSSILDNPEMYHNFINGNAEYA